ncbi:hypothetical protein [Streptomyces sp. URMC 123]|uniref:hypothetical protein n=1 Tax=Streptomyces sp. URMC 123 TaxID=3423403 RepID=UPI003F1B9EF1
MTSYKTWPMVAVMAGLLSAATTGAALADTNDNLADPPITCAASLLAVDQGRPCITEQTIEQDIRRKNANSTDVIDFADVVVPLDGMVAP